MHAVHPVCIIFATCVLCHTCQSIVHVVLFRLLFHSFCVPLASLRLCIDLACTTFSSFCAVVGMSAPVTCPIGFVCPTSGLAAGVPCPRGQYCPVVGLAVAVSCPAGRFNPLLGRNASTACLPCASGEMASPDQSECIATCPAGSYANATASQCVMCPGGVFCLGGINPAIACPAGMRSVSRSPDQNDVSSMFAACASVCMRIVVVIDPVNPCDDKSRVDALGRFLPFETYLHACVLFELSCHCVMCWLASHGDVVAGLYCPVNASFPVVCPSGSYCGASAAAPTACPSTAPLSNLASADVFSCSAYCTYRRGPLFCGRLE
jgi:hypothetical protein